MLRPLPRASAPPGARPACHSLSQRLRSSWCWSFVSRLCESDLLSHITRSLRQSVVAIEPGIGSTRTCPLALGVGLVWMEAFRQIRFLVPSIGLDICG